MKRYLNYLLLIANVIVTIATAIVMILFMNEFKTSGDVINKIYEKLLPTIAIPIVAVVLSSLVIVLYLFSLKKEIKNQDFPLNPRLTNALKNVGLVSFLNLFCAPLLLIVSILINDKEATTILLWLAISLSGVFGLVVAGFVSYFNLRISYSNIQRETLMNQALEENEQLISNEKEETIISEKIEKRTSEKETKKPTVKNIEKDVDNKENTGEATSGSF
ncbi:MAG: hypothetical protein ACRC42_05010 [Mycoplasma sp.]